MSNVAERPKASTVGALEVGSPGQPEPLKQASEVAAQASKEFRRIILYSIDQASSQGLKRIELNMKDVADADVITITEELKAAGYHVGQGRIARTDGTIKTLQIRWSAE